MKIAIVYNEAYPEITDEYSIDLNGKDLGFQPYFDMNGSDPIAEYEAIADAFRKEGHEAYILNILDNIDIFFKDYEINKPDVVFNLVEIYKDIAKLEMGFAGILELMKIPYTGAPPLALGTCQNKTLTKRILSSVGVRTARYKYLKKTRKVYRLNLDYPMIVKPAFEDASVGIDVDAVVTNHAELKKRIDYIFSEYQQPVLVEEYISGRELNVAVLGDKRPRALPISEIDFSEMPDHLYNIVSYQAKWDPYHESYHKTIPICPAKLPKKIEKEAKEVAVKCFKVMQCRDYARVDMRYSKKTKKLYVLEVNPNPDLTQDAGFMRSAKHARLSYNKTLNKIVMLAAKRGGKI
ncbi:MAG: ATP-grasp domain-containing protein [Melioribacteraceae bacterium]|nr:ATP-grasp domain-containing protein [Melioribacteraceae bacterium]MCF8355883.1 ATP-grasp domain-containing protein [Melioribacteraceae bacterium]MCF8395208.1 ATP-grasp domain-containing protein [Melioribacteraceae bacterium]MCF8420682.1 ATP-grasp domain-containing protein [Melioribacteraceae bacterium]